MEKSSFFFSKNVDQEEQKEICSRLGNIKVVHQGKYLGLPMVITRTKDQIFGFVRDKCQKTVSNWCNKKLSQAGKEGEDNGKRKVHWCSWKKMATGKHNGGLGFKDLQGFNKVLLGKQIWRLLTCPNLLMSKVMKAKYYQKESPLSCEVKDNSS
ncbi:uncharacterized protein [Coffea arabica]|uniref:Uncharacterized protein n=1 Tax=Coffea arabica TaxID=13443 RepID=A0ABM4VUA2_COFAR